jgi:hypothetical protein
MRIQICKSEIKIDEGYTTPSDFAVIVKDIPKDIEIGELKQ